jgi:UDP-glucuronate 4-epimerase
MLREEPIPIYGDGSALRDFTYVDDLVDGLVRALDAEFGYALLNFGSGRTVPLLEVVRILEVALGLKARVEWLPRQGGDVSRTWANIEAARSRLGYAPSTEIEEGIRRFVDWLREQS